MKHTLSISVLLVVLAAFMVPSSCVYQNEEDVFGSVGCDTTNVRYSQEVEEILFNNCYSCHSTSANSSGLPFDTYAQLKVFADSDQLVNSMNDVLSPMPPNGLLSECDRAKIKAWVNAGALEN